MTALLLALIIFASVVGYLSLAGVIYIYSYRGCLDRCKNCSGREPDKRQIYYDNCYKEHWVGPVFLALFWPVVGWAVLPAYLADPYRARHKAEAQQARIAALEVENAELERKLRQ